MTRQMFDSLLLNAVDSALCSLGESCQQAIYFHLEKTFSIEKQKIPEKIEEFDRSIKAIFQQGATFLEAAIMQTLCKELGIRLENASGTDFPSAVQSVREIVLRERQFVSTAIPEDFVNMLQNAGGGAC